MNNDKIIIKDRMARYHYCIYESFPKRLCAISQGKLLLRLYEILLELVHVYQLLVYKQA